MTAEFVCDHCGYTYTVEVEPGAFPFAGQDVIEAHIRTEHPRIN